MLNRKKSLVILSLIALVLLAGAAYSVSKIALSLKKNPSSSPAPDPDKYLGFSMEVYDKIKVNYWDKISDEQLAELYKLAIEKVTSSPAPSSPKTRDEVKNMLFSMLNSFGTTADSSTEKKDFVTKLSDIVLYNLRPAGRSRLYTSKLESELKNKVVNTDPTTDLYSVLGLQKGASVDEVKKNYEAKKTELSKDGSPQAKEQLATVQRAFEALSSPDKKQQYDSAGIEPTVISKLLIPDIFYIKLTKFSPQSLEELKKAADSIDPKQKNGPTALIFDLRGNIGGAIDILQYFLGPFIGPDNYAYDFFHQGETTPYKTKLGWFESLVRYKKVVVLIDGQSQSSAEVMAATLKKYNVGILVGTKTRGWGTVEQVMPLDTQIDSGEKYSLFMVHSITLRDDGQPIEGRGVDPTIDIGNKGWPQQLMAYYNYQPLVDQVKKLVAK